MTNRSILLLFSALVAQPINLATSAPAQAAPYVKVCNSGAQAGSGSCSSAPALGVGANDWACTIDQATSLMWEVKTNGGLRSYRSTYTNFDDSTQKQKRNGTNPTASEISSPSNVMGYIAMVNSAALCGSASWRRPVLAELQKLVVGTTAPTIDTASFTTLINLPVPPIPYTQSALVPGVTADKLAMVSFYNGQTQLWPRDLPGHVRLVTTAPIVAALPDCGANSTQLGQQCYGYLIEYAANTYPPGSGHYQDSYGWSTLPATYPKILRCTDPALGAQVKPCMHKYKWVKVTPINQSTQVTNPSTSVEVYPPN